MDPKIDIVIFDVDGVLVDVRDSFHCTILQTVRHFTGKSVPRAEIQDWKNRSGYNDDWKLTTHWIRALGVNVRYAKVKEQFQRFYWGENSDGNFLKERWLLRRARLRRLAKTVELALFTGRTRRELKPTIECSGAGRYFRRIVTQQDVKRLKPHPEGLLRILAGRDPRTALYLGDNIDDALAAQRAGVVFVGVLPPRSLARRLRAGNLRQLGARVILGDVNEVVDWL